MLAGVLWTSAMTGLYKRWQICRLSGRKAPATVLIVLTKC